MKRILNLITIVALVSWLSSCSEKGKDYQSYVADDANMVASIDLHTILDNAGFGISAEGITLPEYLKNKPVIAQNEVVKKLTEIKGIDPTKIIWVMGQKKNQNYAIARLTNAAAFEKSIANTQLEKTTDGAYTIYSADGIVLTVDGDLMLCFESKPDEVAAFIAEITKNATDNPLADWKKAIFEPKTTFTMIVNIAAANADDGLINMLYSHNLSSMQADAIEAMRNGYSVVSMQLQGSELNIKSCIYTKEGKDVPSMMAKVNKDLLKYISAQDFIAAISKIDNSLNWKEFAAGMMAKYDVDSTQVLSFLEPLSGEIMLAAGYTNIQTITANAHVVLALSTVGGKAQQLIDNIRALALSQGAQVTDIDNGIRINIAVMMPPLYATIQGDNVVVSTLMNPADVKTGGTITENDFNDYGGFVMVVPANSPAITFLPIPFGLDIRSTGNEEGSESTIKVTGTEGKLLETILAEVYKYL